MMNETPPITLRFSLSEQEDLDDSDVTCPWSDDDDDDDENSLQDLLQEEDDFDRLIGIKRAGGDPIFRNRLDGATSCPPHIHQPTTPSIQRKVGQQTLIDTIPLKEKHQQDLIDLKLKLASQQEKLDILSSKCSQYQIENEALKTEIAVFVDELALAKDVTEDRSNSSSVGPRGFSLFGNGGNGAVRDGGTMQMLIDTNARLMTDNAQLQVSVDGLQKSLRSYIKFSQRSSRIDKETIEALTQENQSLRQQQQKIKPSAPESEKTFSLSEDTAKTSLESKLDLIDENHVSTNTFTPIDSSSQPQRPSMNQDDGIMQVDSSHSAPTHMQNRRRSEGLLVDFGEARRQRRSRTTARRWSSAHY